MKNTLAFLRQQITRWKTEPGYTEAIGKALQIIGSPDFLSLDALMPQLSAVVKSDHVQLRFKKAGADAVNLYKRKAGETEWLYLARDTNSPYDDWSELAKPNVPEVWEYRAICVLGDEEVGQFSNVVTVTFSGQA